MYLIEISSKPFGSSFFRSPSFSGKKNKQIYLKNFATATFPYLTTTLTQNEEAQLFFNFREIVTDFAQKIPLFKFKLFMKPYLLLHEHSLEKSVILFLGKQ